MLLPPLSQVTEFAGPSYTTFLAKMSATKGTTPAVSHEKIWRNVLSAIAKVTKLMPERLLLSHVAVLETKLGCELDMMILRQNKKKVRGTMFTFYAAGTRNTLGSTSDNAVLLKTIKKPYLVLQYAWETPKTVIKEMAF